MRETLHAQKICFEDITFEMISSNVRRKLSCGSDRIQESLVAYRWLWWPGKTTNENHYNAEKSLAEVEREYHEELIAIRDVLEEYGHSNGNSLLEDIVENDDGGVEPSDRLFFLTLEAMSVWDYIGNPIRQKGDLVFKIGRPRIVEDKPTIQTMSLHSYIDGVRNQMSEYYSQNISLRRQRTWLIVSSLAVLGLSLFLMINNM